MSPPADKRRSTRALPQVNYNESPRDSPKLSDSTRKSLKNKNKSDDEEIFCTAVKTPRKARKSHHEKSEDHEEISPKKLRANRTPSSKALETIVLENSPTMQKLESPVSRRSARKSRLSVQNSDTTTMDKTKKRLKYDESNEPKVLSSAETSDEDDEVDDKENVVKPTMLFDDEEDVEGNKLYSFKTPKKKDSMAALAQHTPKTPSHRHQNKTPSTPKNSRLSEVQRTPTSRPSASNLAKTPRHIREVIKKKLNKVNLEESESDGDFSTSASDFEPSSEESSDDDHESTTESPQKPQSVAARVLKTPSVASTVRRSGRNKGEYQFFLQPDDYFSTATSKTKTSDHTLDRLKNPRLPHDQLIKLLANMTLSKEHAQAVKSLNEDHKSHFDKWLTLFDEGYTVLLHGLGSKRNLLQAFHKEKLADQHVVVINGFFPSLTIKDVLNTVWTDLLEMTSTVAGNPHETVNLIEEEMKSIPALHIFLIVHNIDGTMLRNEKAQSVMSRLANIQNLHVIASIDHINAPLLWNNTMLCNFNFIWFDVTSFLPYTEETAFENSLLVRNSGALELASMKSVFQSLTTNARGIYVLVLKYQLKNGGNPNYQGMSFKELYSTSREAFLVSSDVALRAQLTEFLDHKLAKLKRTVDGAENITIPIKNILLEQFLEQN